ncbi:hypothetical protein [Allofranklinella schreckenbergeri]|uniref:hypothetical protein n=1 Tax=Allofranklinella schreckenbergeri TaxID=1076744 RepID=UPI0011C44F44|nr:hypothetical protein [Allofranklinella schreckenbergeri]
MAGGCVKISSEQSADYRIPNACAHRAAAPPRPAATNDTSKEWKPPYFGTPAKTPLCRVFCNGKNTGRVKKFQFKGNEMPLFRHDGK